MREWKNANIRLLNSREIKNILENFELVSQNLRIRIRNLSKTGSDYVLDFFVQELKEFQNISHIFLNFANPDLKLGHLKEIFNILDQMSVPDSYNYEQLVNYGAINKKEQVEIVSNRASGEALVQ